MQTRQIQFGLKFVSSGGKEHEGDLRIKGVPMRCFVSLMIFVLVCIFGAGSTPFTQTKAPDLIIVNAKIYTVDSKD